MSKLYAREAYKKTNAIPSTRLSSLEAAEKVGEPKEGEEVEEGNEEEKDCQEEKHEDTERRTSSFCKNESERMKKTRRR